jgi:hypothetical protein
MKATTKDNRLKPRGGEVTPMTDFDRFVRFFRRMGVGFDVNHSGKQQANPRPMDLNYTIPDAATLRQHQRGYVLTAGGGEFVFGLAGEYLGGVQDEPTAWLPRTNASRPAADDLVKVEWAVLPKSTRRKGA